MTNFTPEKSYSKKILIIEDINQGIRAIPHFNKESYSPGDTVRVRVKYYDDLNNELEGSRFWYKLESEEKILARGRIHAKTTETTPLEFILPDTLHSIPQLQIWEDHFNTMFELPLNTKIHIDFFPEGVACLLDKPNIIAFKAAYSNGTAADIKGILIDEEGNELDSVQSVHEGMGKFLLLPVKNMNYYLKLTKPDKVSKLFRIPRAKEGQWTIHAHSHQEKIYVEIRNNFQESDTCLFILSMRGCVDYYRWILNSSDALFALPEPAFPSGIAVLTVLDKNLLPRAERLLFINHGKITVPGLKTNRNTYLCRDSVVLDIDLSNKENLALDGQYSLSVYDSEFGNSRYIDEPNIISANFLTPEIRGDIYDPNYYFTSNDKEILYKLDLLLLTQGWRNYKYHEFCAHPDSFKLPVNQDIYKGRVKRWRFARDHIQNFSARAAIFSPETLVTIHSFICLAPSEL